MKKKEFRLLASQKRDSISPKERLLFSNQIFNHLVQSQEYQKSETIFLYLSFRSEVDTFKLLNYSIDIGKKVYAPITIPATKQLLCARVENPQEDLQKDHYGIYSPIAKINTTIDPSNIDLVIVPGLAFDTEGYRMGYGGGYYDRFIPLLSKHTHVIALAFQNQIYHDIPKDKHDKKIGSVLTEKGFVIKTLPSKI